MRCSDENTEITGPCPNDDCSHAFVAASVAQVGEHFMTHTPFDAEAGFMGEAAVRLMELRGEINAE